MQRFLILVIANLLFASAASSQQAMPQTELAVGMYRIEAEVAATGPNREVGLMNRKSMPQQHGMVFVFPQLLKHCMWMRNTLLPLSVAFIDEKGVIINVEDMQPQTENNHCAERNARYALEMNLGWFKSRGFGPGTPISGVERLRPFD